MNVDLVGGMSYPADDCPRRCRDSGVLLRGAAQFDFVAQVTSPFKLCKRLVFVAAFWDAKSPASPLLVSVDTIQETGFDVPI